MRLLFLFRQAWKLGPALATGNVVVMKVLALVFKALACSMDDFYYNRFLELLGWVACGWVRYSSCSVKHA